MSKRAPTHHCPTCGEWWWSLPGMTPTCAGGTTLLNQPPHPAVVTEPVITIDAKQGIKFGELKPWTGPDA